MFPIRTLPKRIFVKQVAPALAVFALAAPGAQAAPTGREASAVGTAEASVVRPIAVVRIADLDFGRVANPGAGAGSMIVVPGGGSVSGPGSVTASFTGGAHAACAAGEACPQVHAAAFTVSGEPGRSYTITLPAGVVATATLAATGASGGTAPTIAPMVDHLSVRTASRPAAGNTGQLDAEGADSFEVGGRLEVPAGVEPTDYRAVIAVVVAYL